MNKEISTLETQYESTTFRVEVPRGYLDIRLGNRHPPIDRLLERLGATEWAYITAWNPQSQAVSHAQNGIAQEQLKQCLRAHGLHFYQGDGIPDAGDWTPERSVWVAGIGRQDAIDIGGQFGQTAIVVGTNGGVAELVYCLTVEAR